MGQSGTCVDPPPVLGCCRFCRSVEVVYPKSTVKPILAPRHIVWQYPRRRPLLDRIPDSWAVIQAKCLTRQASISRMGIRLDPRCSQCCCDDLPLRAGHCYMSFVGQMHAKPTAGNHRRLRVSSAHQFIFSLATMAIRSTLAVARWCSGIRC